MFKKLLPACLIAISAFVLFACSKDAAPSNNAPPASVPTLAIVNSVSDSAISGIYFRYTYKGYTELFKDTVDSVGFMYYHNNIYFAWTTGRKGVPFEHKSVAEFNFGKTWPTGTGTFNNAIFWIGDYTSYRSDNMEYTITRNAANFGDTVEVKFKGLVTEEDAVGTPDTTTVIGDFRAVLVNNP
ncbi:hypothetical protein [Chitinophaga ginsengisoli]|uniref:Uncharacterized protein n=1 Tax=Chitinophaga ginsengisoli TaxID=363837 RepID=A0A2P8FM17_9BACT|nr:hypothetical protein [Chitinophaga ginsengisoli]PSL22746.1 hypothetical protein CLV42_1207 [Chitinophaga ginsengisoli]